MDVLNEYYPLYPENPDAVSTSESEENGNYIDRLDTINVNKKRKKILVFDDFCLKYNDEMWYIWCIINDYSIRSNVLNKLDFATFCDICYQNSTQW
jgi:hypothetical protein